MYSNTQSNKKQNNKTVVKNLWDLDDEEENAADELPGKNIIKTIINTGNENAEKELLGNQNKKKKKAAIFLTCLRMEMKKKKSNRRTFRLQNSTD